MYPRRRHFVSRCYTCTAENAFQFNCTHAIFWTVVAPFSYLPRIDK
jgi:hypothetical protein